MNLKIVKKESLNDHYSYYVEIVNKKDSENIVKCVSFEILKRSKASCVSFVSAVNIVASFGGQLIKQCFTPCRQYFGHNGGDY